jgi:hypothetical protein
MHLLVILLQQLLGMLPSKQPVPQAEVVRPRPAEPRNSDSASFAGLSAGFYGVGFEIQYGGGWGRWSVLPMLEAKEIRAPWGAEFRRRQKPGRNLGHLLSPGESPGEK